MRTKSSNPKRQGIALVMVLFLVAILGILVVAILSISTGELKSAKVYSEGIAVRQMNETAVNLAISQIGIGSTQIDQLSGREVWASQPGAIRVYSEKGNFVRGVKLYSDSQMIAHKEEDLAGDVPPTDWDSDDNKSRYVDLNEPVIRKEDIFFPVVNPIAIQAGIDGFDFDESAVNGSKKLGDKLEVRLPMPVEWLYVLRRGEFGTLNKEGKFTGPVKATGDNPIVGRIAFWTDDESSKINVNTASEPTFWDTPRAISKKDLDYGRYQPGRNEFQRYPGHPAQTALGPVLFPNESVPLTAEKKEEIYRLIPRIGTGGTIGGTRRQPPGAPIRIDNDRLFATIDEFIFQPNRERIGLISPETLRMSGFFLTANSRAPELNPLGRPKVAMWPLGATPVFPRTAYDHLIAFCATAGDHLYAFQRGFAKSSAYDWDEIERNREIYQWIIRELSEKVPGTGETFLDKFDEDLPQVVTEIFDYIRCTNLMDLAPVVKDDGSTARARFFAYYYNQRADAGEYRAREGDGQVAPIRIDNDTMGFGRFFTISEFGFHFICSGHGSEGIQPPGGDENQLDEDERLIEIGFLMEPFSVSMGWPPLHNQFTVKITGLDAIEIEQVNEDGGLSDESAGFPAERNYKPHRLWSSWHGRAWGGSSGIRTCVASGYPYISKRLRVKGDTLKFPGATLEVEIYEGVPKAGEPLDQQKLVQTIQLEFPPTDLEMPDLVETGTGGFRGTGRTNPDFWWNLRNRYRNARRTPHTPGNEYADITRRWPRSRDRPGFRTGGVFRMEDVVRTMVPGHGDYRLIAARAQIPNSVFVPGPNYSDKSTRIEHFFSDTQGTHLLYGFSNEPGLTSTVDTDTQLTPAQYHYARLPDALPGVGAFNQFGDFDNGIAQIGDGAFINRPDEGNVATKWGTYAYFTWNYAKPRFINFSPNRMVSSPGMFGSLPTGVKRDQPWQTLLFRPQPDHPGNSAPHDHHFMEYFWMPVVEPYAISVPFATAGKVNMNYQILPFNYINRSTGLHGILKAEEPLAIPNEMSKIYKLWDHETSDHPQVPDQRGGNTDSETAKDWRAAARGNVVMRNPINIKETLLQFEEKFARNSLFKYPSEICELHLVRKGEDLAEYRGDFWSQHVVTGDNVRERPYANIYPRLTTRSNVFRVHTRAEVFRKSKYSSHDTFDPEVDSIAGRYRGSTLVERYIDPTDNSLIDYADEENSNRDLHEFYRYRLLETKRFSP